MSKKSAEINIDNQVKVRNEILKLAESLVNGKLNERCSIDNLDEESASLVQIINNMVDSLVTPLRLLATSIDQIAHGRIPAFIIDDYKGEFNSVKRNLNTLLATLYGMHNETQNLLTNIKNGRLDTRGNDWDFEGNWHDLIFGVNSTLDAVINPVLEAKEVLKKMSNYDLTAKIKGKYHGDHAIIKKALNTTSDSLESAISQVADVVSSVNIAAQKISQSSQVVAQGASELGSTIKLTSENLFASFKKSDDNTELAKQNAINAKTSMMNADKSMGKLLNSIGEIKTAAENTLTIVSEINEITSQTYNLFSSAAEKSAKVRSSAGGFGIVAGEINSFSEFCLKTSEKLKNIKIKITEKEQIVELTNVIQSLDDISTTSKFLGVNAAIEAAHVSAAGKNLEQLTEEMNSLAKRTETAAIKTDQFMKESVILANNGEIISMEIADQLVMAVDSADEICTLTALISENNKEQALELDKVNNAVAEINRITDLNAKSAAESSSVVIELENQMYLLSEMVEKFNYSHNLSVEQNAAKIFKIA